MPTYDYRCEANSRTVEVKHRISETVSTWGELCQLSGQDLGNTAADAPVRRLANGGQVLRSGSLGDSNAPPCSSGPCCSGGACGVV